MFPRRILSILALIPALGLSQDGFYPFAVDQDNLAGAPDFSFLNSPLTDADKISAIDGRFVTAAGRRVRFFGVNLAFGANFPEPKDAGRIAKRLRRLGVNLVRLHHMDTQPDSNAANAGSLLTTGPYPTLNNVAVERLRIFLDTLKAEGIYVNLNLKVGYAFRPTVDGVPNAAIPTQSKPLHIFAPRMIALQQEFAAKVIEALRLRDDPVLAMVEINNESSLLYSYQTNQLQPSIAGPYHAELQRQWNGFLNARYSSTEKLREAWGPTEPDSGNLLPNRWQLELHSNTAGAIANIDDGAIQLNLTRNETEVIAKQVGFSIDIGDAYLAEVEFRADRTVTVSWDIKQDVSPWRQQTNRTVAVTTDWRQFTMSYTAGFGMENVGRFGVQLTGSTVPVQIRNARLIRRGRRGLAESESLEQANIALPGTEGSHRARTHAYIEFLAALDRSYLDTLLSTIRESTGGKVPVAGTQMDFGGLMTIDTHAAMDHHDFHFYVDHYNFPNVQWDGRDWRIRDSSHLGANLSNLIGMAVARPFGKPFTVSEFNQNWPSTRGHELLPPMSAFAAFQDWDGLMHFAYSHGRGWDANVPNGFNLNGDWSKWIGFGQSAWMFRSEAIGIGPSLFKIPVSYDDRLRFTRENRNRNFVAFLNETQSIQSENAFRYRFALDPNPAAGTPDALTERPSSPYTAETGELQFNAGSKVFQINAPQAAGVLGEWAGMQAAGPLDIETETRVFRTVLLTALDNQAIARSERLLLTNPGHTLRSRNAAQPSQPQRIVNYPGTRDWFTVEADVASRPSGDLNGGVGPTWMEKTPVRITLRTQHAELAVYPLDGAGRRMEAIVVTPSENGLQFTLSADAPWYEIVAVPRDGL
ncbi:MAG: hypothetical protein ACKV2U_29180 [Bryobacteraceae bacterium]